ncbi:hypothetical protein [Escherichia coli]|nr:hypothetical protein [Escherichia coli]MCZ9046482.1 hypothetical protein [Escherichia albertii]MCZ9051404.1 hypothetical protein [Escherichia albertii]
MQGSYGNNGLRIRR